MTNYKIAMAAGRDAANRAMMKAGRSRWTLSDYRLCARTVERLLKVMGAQ